MTSQRSLQVGDKEMLIRRFTASDIEAFADVTGDRNPLHVDEIYAQKTQFGKPIVHGTLTLGFISGIIASKLPGPGSVLLRQAIDYPSPLFVGEEVSATVEVLRYRKQIARLSLLCVGSGEKVVLKGTVDVLYENNAP